ncbi:MAG: hypothetical protein CEE38_17470 [Planctomycetes bacterium B3_Pla]|nr:MAG: hypothetical protein CEE38_17470 [Planctomycetes bacterium B3_Pla]
MLEWIGEHSEILVGFVVPVVSGLLWLLFRLSNRLTVVETLQEENVRPRMKELSDSIKELSDEVDDIKEQLNLLESAQTLLQTPIKTLPSRKRRKTQRRPMRTKKT